MDINRAEKLAVFDFDETIIAQNSLHCLFSYFGGKLYWIFAIPTALMSLCNGQFGYPLRLAVKKSLYRKYLRGRSAQEVRTAGARCLGRLTVNNGVMCKLQQYLAQDTSVIIATASPDNFVSGIVETLNLPDIFIIGTRICRHTGNIIGEECSRENKWIRVSNHAEKTGAKKIIAYGNEPDDLVLLKKADEGYIVNQQSIKPIKSS